MGIRSQRKKNCVLKWEYICKIKENGRLGVKDLKLFNMTLLAKWKWILGRMNLVCGKRF